MQPEIRYTPERKLAGRRLIMSLTENRISELWRSFLPEKDLIPNRLNDELMSVAVYDPGYFHNYDPARTFEKWAAAELSDFSNLPVGMETLILPAGMYAVFEYRGFSTDTSIFQYIFGSWLPASEYLLDARPHFEILGKNYRINHADSEEQIWIPVKEKSKILQNF